MATDEILKAATDHLIAFSVFSVPPAALTILAICMRRSWIGRLRLGTVIPFAVAGALATKLFNPIREGKTAPDVKGTLRIIFGIASVAVRLPPP
jgi:hypothetical protein